MKDVVSFRDFFMKVMQSNKKAKGYSEYGSAVTPILEEYKKIQEPDERKAFQSALEELLQDKNEEVRHFAVTVCLGFFVFSENY
jgi:hypothetical protein